MPPPAARIGSPPQQCWEDEPPCDVLRSDYGTRFRVRLPDSETFVQGSAHRDIISHMFIAIEVNGFVERDRP